MEPTQIIQRPLITEKSTHEQEQGNRYSFLVDMRASKTQIKSAVESIYSVRVNKVHTQIRKGKYFRTRFGPAKKPNWKKAAVQLHEDDRIELF